MVVMVMVVQQRDGTMAAMGWRPAWCATLSFLLVLLLGQGAWTQHPGDHAGALEEDYTLLTYDYPAEGLDYYEYMDYYGPFTPNLANTTLRKCRCQVDQVWGDDHCQEATTYVNVIDLWAKHHVPANASDFGEVEVGEVICPKGHVKVVLDHNSGLRDAFFLLENGGLFWRDDTFPDYCIEHILDTSGKPTSMEAHICLPPPPVSLCCPPGHALLRNGTCYPDAAAVDVPLSMEVEGQHVTWVIESEGVVTNISCGSEDTYYKRLTEANVTLVYHPRGVVLQWLPPTQHNRPRDRHQYCLGVEVGAHGQVAQYSTLFCYTDMIAAYHEACHNATCIRKCCPEHTIMHGVECIPVHDPSKMWTPKFHERESLSPVASSPEDLTIVHGLPFCESFFKMRPDETEDDRYYLMEDGTVHAPSFSGFSYSAMQYCIDNFIADHPLQEHALLCFIDKTGCNSVQSMAIPALLAVSCVFLAITLLVYVSVPELHAKVHGKCLVSHVTALLLAYLCLIIVQWSAGRLPGAACKIMASLIHVSFLAAFFWLNVMCFDIWWTLKSMRPVAETGELSRLRFKMYSIYSWGCPLFISFVAIIVDSLPEDFDVIRPGFGEKKCWFGDNQPLWAYFYGFVLTLVVANILLFCQVAYILIMAQNDPILQRTRQQNRERMWLYIKLFVVMGLTWITEVISWQEGSCEPWIISDVINALQGFSIFLIFICKRNMLKRIRNNWEPYLRRMKVFVGSSRQPDSVKGKGAQDTSSFTSSVNRPSSQSGASQRTVQSQISLDTSSAFRREYKVALQTTRGKKKNVSSSTFELRHQSVVSSNRHWFPSIHWSPTANKCLLYNDNEQQHNMAEGRDSEWMLVLTLHRWCNHLCR
ncbi:uncharacterized protein LOC123503143 isoform X2 [Portunus trituberculatus]|uniref:uncharacterized protein LOC123503143 isoform X2 n=1 Tax=Portunus trituberculatus TaxID=210409 RepID=UPI001E1D02D3|nr:uncharacterized protein LOC123503143 isoform X2 [Portunus trituberculatus]